MIEAPRNEPRNRGLSRRLARCAMLAVATLAALPSLAQDRFPSKPIRLITQGVGGAGDLLTRRLAERLSKSLGTPVVVENLPGANGSIATLAVARAAPDGYTILMGTSTTHASNASFLKSLPYDPINDFEPITRLGLLPFVLGVSNSVPANNLQEFIAYAKANPGKIAFGSGTGTGRLASEMLKQRAGIDILNVPYKSNGQALTDLRGGQIQMLIGDIALMQPHIRAGAIRGMGVTSARRSAIIPELPTLAEAGATGYELVGWMAAFARAKTPEPIVRRLNEEIVRILRDKEFTDILIGLGIDTAPSTPAELREWVITETRKWRDLARAAGIQPE